jgi:hypothetical protein
MSNLPSNIGCSENHTASESWCRKPKGLFPHFYIGKFLFSQEMFHQNQADRFEGRRPLNCADFSLGFAKYSFRSFLRTAVSNADLIAYIVRPDIIGRSLIKISTSGVIVKASSRRIRTNSHFWDPTPHSSSLYWFDSVIRTEPQSRFQRASISKQCS